MLTVNVDVHEGVEDRFHELIGQGAEVVVEQLHPLQAVEVLEGRSGDLANPGKKKKRKKKNMCVRKRGLEEKTEL